MKILIVSEDIPQPHLGGLGKHALALAHELHRRGHQVDVLGSALHPIDAQPEQAGPGRFFGAIRGHQRGWGQTRLGLFHPAANALRARAVARAIRRHAAGYDVVHYHGHLPWLARYLPRALPFTQSRHDQGGDCSLHTRFRPEGQRCPLRDPAACAGCATPAPNGVQRALSAWAVRRMRQQTAAAYVQRPVIFVSSFLRDAFAAVSPHGCRGEVVHNAVDTAALQTVLDSALQPPATVADGRAQVELFTAGAFNAYKGFGVLLDALAAQGGLPAGWRLTLAGDGPDLASLRQRHASPSLRFLGWCAYPAVVAQTAAADAVVVPSECDEACPTTVLEALALGRVVYALRRGGTPELAVYAAAAASGSGAQLRLFDTMPALVQALLQHRAQADAPAAAALAGFGGSVATMADRVLAHYRHHFPATVRAR